jgi:NAD+ kinase
MTKIGLVYDKRNKEAREFTLSIADWLEERKVKHTICSTRDEIDGDVSLIVTFGGDGTVLHVANKVLRNQTPILRVNFGTRGILCNVDKSRVYWAVGKILDNNFRIEKKTRICAEIEGRDSLRVDAFNEILIGGINFRNSWLRVAMENGKKNSKAKKIFWATGDGLLFATQNGSTAWSSSAGGPQLLADVFCVTGSNAVLKSEADWIVPNAKSLVVSLDAVFKVMTLRSGPYKPYVVADGQRYYRMKKDDVVVIKKSPYKTLFVELK